ncbi:MAG: DUF5663 domain-containing protein [Candidatus Nanoperiomorbaceae bacterium]
MYQLDDEFKQALALDKVKEEDRNALYASIEQSVNTLINNKLYDVLSDEQAEEFANVTDGDNKYLWQFLNTNLPTWEKTPEWSTFRQQYIGDADLSSDEFNELARTFAVLKWLQLNVPNYAEIVADARNNIYDRIIKPAKPTADENS